MRISRLCLILSLLIAAPLAYAGEALLTDEVSVDVTGKDAADARDKAMLKADTDALNDLLNKLAPPEQVQSIIKSLNSKKIAGLVRGTEVVEEHISENHYRATLIISFDADGISTLVGSPTTAPATDANVVTSSFLILPELTEGDNAYLWDEGNPWLKAWKNLGIEMNTGDIVVPYGDANDGAVVNAQTISSANYPTLAPLAIRYGTSDIVIVHATLTKDPELTLSVVKRRMNRLHNEVSMLTYRADAQETRETLFSRAARDIAENLRHEKLQEVADTKLTGGGEHNKVMVLASITTLSSWTQLKAKLTSLPMIDKLEVVALSPQQVDMILYYRGTPDSLARSISGLGVRITQNKDYWVVSRD